MIILRKQELGALVIGGIGLAAKMFLSSSQSKNNEQIKLKLIGKQINIDPWMPNSLNHQKKETRWLDYKKK